MEKNLTVVYCTYNRDYYTGITLPRVIDECRNSKHFKELYIFDDDSTDSTEKIIRSIDFPFVYIQERHRNTVWQLNRMRSLLRTEFLYGIGNDILMPEGIFDFMTTLMLDNKGFLSLMIEEEEGLPYIKDNWYIDESYQTSSLGIHRFGKFKEDFRSQKTFFGFQPLQHKTRQENGMKVGWVRNVANTNLDASCWSKAEEYKKKGLQRILTGTERSVYKI